MTLRQKLLRAFADLHKQPRIADVVDKLFANHEKSAGRVALTDFTKSVLGTQKRPTKKQENGVKSLVSKARGRLKELERRGEMIEHDGKLYAFGITEDIYELTVQSIPDPLFHHKRFWAPYRDERRKNDVLVGVLARFFFRIQNPYQNEAGETVTDEVYIRSKLVNKNQSEVGKSPILDRVLKEYKGHRPYRQYMSTHDVLGAFLLLEMFGHMGVSARGNRTPVMQSIDVSAVILGTSKDYESVHIPRRANSYMYEIGSDGVHAKGGVVEDTFRDHWREDSKSIIHVLLSRWETGGHVFTTIHSNGASAIEGVCDALCSGNYGEQLGEIIKILWGESNPIPGAFETVFSVTLENEPSGYRAVSISVCGPGNKFEPVWP